MKIGILGLGYVGLPLLYALSKNYKLVGYDVNSSRVKALNQFNDTTFELNKYQLKTIFKNSIITNNHRLLEECTTYIITVPTPLKKNFKPNLSLVKNASLILSKYIKKNDIIILESTVYPGVTENFIAKIVEKNSGLIFNKDFFCAYSPERINPGDKKRTILNVTKVIGANDTKTLNKVSKIYKSFLGKNIHLTKSIKIAEASKIIENAQRDLNIAFMNEIQLIFDKADIPIYEVLKAAKTKWNFLPFEPGLVGGHCIGIDPYYLTEYAKFFAIKPKLVLAGRGVNENEKNLVISKIIKKRKKNKLTNILILGITFKENCPDLRNSKPLEITNQLCNYKGIKVSIYDPFITKTNDLLNKKIKVYAKLPYKKDIDIIAILVKHKNFKKLNLNDIKNMSKNSIEIIDYKKILI